MQSKDKRTSCRRKFSENADFLERGESKNARGARGRGRGCGRVRAGAQARRTISACARAGAKAGRARGASALAGRKHPKRTKGLLRRRAHPGAHPGADVRRPAATIPTAPP
jgi:hypothetical protein